MSDPDLVSGHGGRIDAMARAFPDAPLPWIDLSTGINPAPYPLPQIPTDAWTRLPGEVARASCENAMAGAFGCDPAYCRAVAGTEVAIRQLPSILRAKTVAVRAPSYADHAHSWRSDGASVVTGLDPLELVEEADVLVLVNPNNPDGHCWPVERIEHARARLAKRGGWLIVDEAYADLDPSKSVAPFAGRQALIVLRSFGKFYGLAGLRLGAVLALPDVLREIGERLGGWDVSGPALAIGKSAYANVEWQAATRKHLVLRMHKLRTLIASAGLNDRGGTDLFRFVQASDAPALWRKLARHGIAVRRFAGDDHHLRIGLPADAAQFDRLAEALNP